MNNKKLSIKLLMMLLATSFAALTAGTSGDTAIVSTTSSNLDSTVTTVIDLKQTVATPSSSTCSSIITGISVGPFFQNQKIGLSMLSMDNSSSHNQLNRIEAKIDGQGEQLGTISSQISGQSKQLGMHGERLSRIESGVTKVNDDLGSFRQEANGRFNDLGQQLDTTHLKLSDQILGVDGKIATLDQKVTQRFDQTNLNMKQGFNGMDSRFDAIDARLSSIENIVNNIKAEVAKLGLTLDDVLGCGAGLAMIFGGVPALFSKTSLTVVLAVLNTPSIMSFLSKRILGESKYNSLANNHICKFVTKNIVPQAVRRYWHMAQVAGNVAIGGEAVRRAYNVGGLATLKCCGTGLKACGAGIKYCASGLASLATRPTGLKNLNQNISPQGLIARAFDPAKAMASLHTSK